ncbi:hypothetical protein [Vibrio sp. PNB22_4_1]|uniref:hypothetical protein n=1 Tax=unclassified Vibrio TaxID=2614977 RepID=UPI00406A316B
MDKHQDYIDPSQAAGLANRAIREVNYLTKRQRNTKSQQKIRRLQEKFCYGMSWRKMGRHFQSYIEELAKAGAFLPIVNPEEFGIGIIAELFIHQDPHTNLNHLGIVPGFLLYSEKAMLSKELFTIAPMIHLDSRHVLQRYFEREQRKNALGLYYLVILSFTDILFRDAECSKFIGNSCSVALYNGGMLLGELIMLDEKRQCFRAKTYLCRHQVREHNLTHCLNPAALSAIAEQEIPTMMNQFDQGKAAQSEILFNALGEDNPHCVNQ